MNQNNVGIGKYRLVLAIMAVSSGTACVPGYNSVVFTARSNAGLDFDTTPPVTEVSIAREEIVIAPTFESGQTLPVLASFSSSQNFVSKFLFGVGSTFSTGEAAYNMAVLYDSQMKDAGAGAGCTARYKVGLSQVPDLPFGLKYQQPGTVKPVVFTANTMLGIRIGWTTSTAAAVPSSLKIGFNRKEIAWTPVSLENCNGNGTTGYRVNIPPLLASLDTETVVDPGDTRKNLTFLQYFATGTAAAELSKQYGVRKAMLGRMDPNNLKVFNERKAELENFQTRLDLGTALGVAAIERITTVGQANTAKAVLDEYPYVDAGDCPALPTLPADTAAVLDQTQLQGVQNALKGCLGSAGNGSEEQVVKFEAVITKLNGSIP